MHHRHFQSCSFFNCLLNSEHLLFKFYVSSLLLLVLSESCENNVSNRTLLLVAEFFSLSEITLLKSRLNSCCELTEVTLTISRANSESTFDCQSNNCDEESPNDRYDEPTLVHSTYDTCRFVRLILEEVEGNTCCTFSVEVAQVTCTEYIKTLSDKEADDNYCESGLDAGETLRFLGGTLRCRSICSCH